jgi:hypothetical protein
MPGFLLPCPTIIVCSLAFNLSMFLAILLVVLGFVILRDSRDLSSYPSDSFSDTNLASFSFSYVDRSS